MKRTLNGKNEFYYTGKLFDQLCTYFGLIKLEHLHWYVFIKMTGSFQKVTKLSRSYWRFDHKRNGINGAGWHVDPEKVFSLRRSFSPPVVLHAHMTPNHAAATEDKHVASIQIQTQVLYAHKKRIRNKQTRSLVILFDCFFFVFWLMRQVAFLITAYKLLNSLGLLVMTEPKWIDGHKSETIFFKVSVLSTLLWCKRGLINIWSNCLADINSCQ